MSAPLAQHVQPPQVEQQPSLDAHLAALRVQINPHLESLWQSSSAPAGLLEGMRYGLLGGGKRLRATLVLATAQALGHDPSEVLPIAATIEMIHAYTLIHDDLPAMDDAELRRGEPSCHRRYGEGLAILIGDTLFAEAIATLVRDQPGTPPRVLAALAAILRFVGVEGLAAGQFLDLSGAAHASPQLHTPMARLKTASLFRASVLSVAAWAGAPAPLADALDRYACGIGELFQLRDDILDASASAEQTGKHPGADTRNGRFTHLDATGGDQERLQACARRLYGEALAALSPLGDQPLLAAIAELIAPPAQ